ncbi:hypothetical protein D9M72_451760 [compost metagenome]
MVAAGAARAAMVPQSRAGMTGAGRESGRAPIRATGRSNTWAAMLAMTMAMREPGICGWIRGAAVMMTATSATSASGARRAAGDAVVSPWTAETAALLFGPALTPKAAGTCWRKMIMAIPRVNPSITGQGSRVTTRPSLRTPAAMTMTPARTATAARAPAPCVAMTGPRTTTIAPVGPETWILEPPKTAATMPAITAVISPLAAPAPELTPKARASGRATMPTVTPAMRSPFQVRGRSA